MISPINIATQGLLDSPLAVAAVRGRLSIGGTVTPPILGGGGGPMRGGFEDPRAYDITPHKLAALRAQLLNEDDEIIIIVTTAMEVLQ